MDDIKQRVEELTLLANELAASNQELDNKVEALQSENKRLREALEFYSDRRNYSQTSYCEAGNDDKLIYQLNAGNPFDIAIAALRPSREEIADYLEESINSFEVIIQRDVDNKQMIQCAIEELRGDNESIWGGAIVTGKRIPSV